MTEAELIMQCKHFNKEAQKELYLRYSPVFKGVCQRYGCAGYSAMDILQDGFIKIFSNIKQYKGEGSFEGWMRRIIVNTALAFYRKKGKEPGFVEINQPGIASISEQTTDSESLFEILANKLSKEDVVECLNLLPEHLKLVLNLYIFENFSHKEIADQLSITLENSKIRLMRGRNELQKLLIALLKKKHPECMELTSIHKFQNAI